MAESPGELRRLLDQERRELRDALGGQSGGRPGDRESGDRGAALDRRRGRPRPRGRARARRCSSRSRCARTRSSSLDVGASETAAPKARKHFPFAASCVRHAPADPVGDADEVRGVLLREVLDAERAGHGEVDRLARSRRRAGAATARRARRGVDDAVAGARSGAAPGPGARRPRSPSRCTSPWRSSAATRREVVLFGRPGPLASSPTDGGCADSTTRTSSCAARSIAWVPLVSVMRARSSHMVELVFHRRILAVIRRTRQAARRRYRRPRC